MADQLHTREEFMEKLEKAGERWPDVLDRVEKSRGHLMPLIDCTKTYWAVIRLNLREGKANGWNQKMTVKKLQHNCCHQWGVWNAIIDHLPVLFKDLSDEAMNEGGREMHEDLKRMAISNQGFWNEVIDRVEKHWATL